MAKTSKALSRLDGWVNVLTKLGDPRRDKRLGGRIHRSILTEFDAEELWLGDDQAARVIELPPQIQYRAGIKVRVSELQARAAGTPYAEENYDADGGGGVETDDLKEAEEGMHARLDELNATSLFMAAKQWARAYGGSALLLGLDDGQADLSQPVRLPTLKAVRYLVLLRPRECWPASWATNPLSVNYGKPVLYNVQREPRGSVPTALMKVHHSRLLRFDGVRVSARQVNANRGWGSSVLERCVDVLRDFQTSHQTVPVLLQDFAQAVYKMKGLAELLASGDDAIVTKRVEQIDMARSLLRAVLTDAEDEYTRLQTPVAGLPELLDRQSGRWAAAARIPQSLLFGDAPAGLHATGDANTRWFYDELEGERETNDRPRWNRLLRYIFQSREGPTGGREPEKWSVHFGPMWRPTAAEIADIRAKTATADKAYVDAGILLPEEVATSRFGGDEWNPDTKLDMAARDAQKAADEAIAADPAAAAALATMPGAKPRPGALQPKPAEKPTVDPTPK